MSAMTRVNNRPEDLETAINDLLSKENRMRAQDPVSLYAGRQGNGTGTMEIEAPDSEPTLPTTTAVTVVDPPTSFDPTALSNEWRRHTETICSMMESTLDRFDELSRKMRTELREMKRRQNATNDALIKMAHEISITVPDMEARVHKLSTVIIRASGD
jgi:hypothetical protein